MQHGDFIFARMVKEEKRKSKEYSESQRKEALARLTACGYDFRGVSNTTGININTLRSWASRSGLMPLRSSTDIHHDFREELIANNFKALSILAFEATKRALTIVKYEEDLNKVNNTLKTVSQLVSLLTSPDSEAKSLGAGSPQNLIQQTILMYNRLAHE